MKCFKKSKTVNFVVSLSFIFFFGITAVIGFILRDVVDTQLRCGGKYNRALAANLVPSPTVKEF